MKTRVQAAGILQRSLIIANTEKCERFARGLVPIVVSIGALDSICNRHLYI